MIHEAAPVKTVHIYIALAVMVATVLSTFIGIGERIGQITSQFDELSRDVRSIEGNMDTLTTVTQENEKRLIRQEERMEQIFPRTRPPDPWERSATRGRQFDK